MHELELPYPPSVNHYYRRVGPKTLISREGRRYRTRVKAILRDRRVQRQDGPLVVTVEVYPPDARRRDLDNVMKSLFDSLEKGGAYRNDSQIKELHAHMREPLRPHGMAVVTIRRKES